MERGRGNPGRNHQAPDRKRRSHAGAANVERLVREHARGDRDEDEDHADGAGTSTDANVNTACDAAFNLTVKKPGDSTTGNLTLKDEGSLAATALKTFATTCTDSDASGETYHGTGSLCSKVQLYIQQYSDAQYTTPSVCLYGAATVPGTCDFSDTAKTLGAFATAYPSSTSALGLGAVSAGSSVYLKVGVKLPSTADNTVQGRKAAIDVSWMLEQ